MSLIENVQVLFKIFINSVEFCQVAEHIYYAIGGGGCWGVVTAPRCDYVDRQ